jgi:hypothetical protein
MVIMVIKVIIAVLTSLLYLRQLLTLPDNGL